MTDNNKALTPISQAQRMLAEATTIPELMELRDFAIAAKAWAKARGMEISEENKAAEVILRAERKVGENLAELKKRGVIFGGKTRGPEDQTTRQALGRRQDRESKGALVRTDDIRMTLADLEVHPRESSDFQRLANMTEEQFESMLQAAHVEGARLSKFNFYNALKRAEEGPRESPSSLWTTEDPGFGMFRAGVYNLLGWQVNEAGVGVPTRNGLFELPADELTQIKTLVEYLARAYSEVIRV